MLSEIIFHFLGLSLKYTRILLLPKRNKKKKKHETYAILKPIYLLIRLG